MIFPVFANERNSIDENVEIIQNSLFRLLNTRCCKTVDDYILDSNESIWFYGIPDMLHLSGNNEEDSKKILRCIRTAVQKYEKRFLLNNIKLDSSLNKNYFLMVDLMGSVKIAGGKSSGINIRVPIIRS